MPKEIGLGEALATLYAPGEKYAHSIGLAIVTEGGDSAVYFETPLAPEQASAIVNATANVSDATSEHWRKEFPEIEGGLVTFATGERLGIDAADSDVSSVQIESGPLTWNISVRNYDLVPLGWSLDEYVSSLTRPVTG